MIFDCLFCQFENLLAHFLVEQSVCVINTIDISVQTSIMHMEEACCEKFNDPSTGMLMHD